uniref:ATP synthase protein I n=1 Tax=Candidatus Kentrum sp. SD TaxID=2126332 RepID=A0A450YDH1_9GAMM|nr:MAG: ATP synthase protein I [Candidatus Kentron sp. SD]
MDQVVLFVGIQTILIVGISVAYLVTLGWFKALAVVYGGGMALFNTWMLMMRIRLAKKIAENMPGREIGALYIGAIQRFISILVLFIIGMAILKLDSVPLLIGFAISQVGGRVGIYFFGFQPEDQNTKRVVK